MRIAEIFCVAGVSNFESKPCKERNRIFHEVQGKDNLEQVCSVQRNLCSRAGALAGMKTDQ